MNRWITRFAFPGKCGVRGASGPLTGGNGPAAPRTIPSVSNQARAILPSPTPHSPRKCRRATNWQSCSLAFIALPLRHQFVDVHQHPRHRCPRCSFHRPGFCPGHRPGTSPILAESLLLRSIKPQQGLLLFLRRRPGQDPPEQSAHLHFSVPVSSAITRPRAWVASTTEGSFSNIRACRGVLDVSRLA